MALRARCFLLACWGLASTVFAQANRVTNGDFELDSLDGWHSTHASTTLARSSSAAYAGSAGLAIHSTDNWCPNGARYTLDASQFQRNTLYEFDARVRLAPGGTAANLHMGLLRNRTKNPVWLDGEQSSYDGGVVSERWTRLHGAWVARLNPGDSLQLCINGAAGQTFYVDDLRVTALTPAEVGYTPPASFDSASWVRASGHQLVMGDGATPFTLNGINLYLYDNGYDTGRGKAIMNFQYKCADEAAYAEIRALGFNSVRLMMSFLLFEDNRRPGVYKPEGWALLDRQVQWARQHGLRLVLDMHEAPGGYQSFDGFRSFGTRRDLQKRLENLWVAIALRYRYENTIVAYDLLNEPYMNHWFDYAETLASKIRTVDPYHTLIVEESFHPDDPGMRLLADNNLLYDIHFYSPWNFSSVHSSTEPYTGDVAWFKATLRSYLPDSFFDSGQGRFNVPIHVGEYGVVHEKFEQALGAQQWMRDITAAFDAYGIHRQLFAYNEKRFGIYQGWNTYAGEHTVTTQGLRDVVQELNGTGP